MNNITAKKQLGLVISCALALSGLSGMARADINPADTGYLTDQRGAVVKSGFGLCWHTGTGPAAPSTPECDPNYVAPKVVASADAASPPAEVLAAPKPASSKVTLNADTLFDFDKAVLRPAGRAALDEFVAKIKEITPEVITAVGHADRFGSDSYNQTLSERRAGSVRAYLMSKGIDSDRIKVEGRGESQPVTKPGECAGAKSAKVIACLQPDRRVDIEVIGTRNAN